MEKRSNIWESETCECIISIVLVILFMCIVPLLILTALAIESKVCPNDPNSISASASLSKVENLSNITTSSSTFTFDLSIKLVPLVDAKYGNTTVFLSQDNNGTSIIDESPVPGARLRCREARRLDVSVRMVSHYRFNDSVLVYSDPVASEGTSVVRVRAHVRFSGEEVGGFVLFKKRPVAEVGCELAVDLKSRTLAYSECQPKVSCKAKA